MLIIDRIYEEDTALWSHTNYGQNVAIEQVVRRALLGGETDRKGNHAKGGCTSQAEKPTKVKALRDKHA